MFGISKQIDGMSSSFLERYSVHVQWYSLNISFHAPNIVHQREILCSLFSPGQGRNWLYLHSASRQTATSHCLEVRGDPFKEPRGRRNGPECPDGGPGARGWAQQDSLPREGTPRAMPGAPEPGHGAARAQGTRLGGSRLRWLEKGGKQPGPRRRRSGKAAPWSGTTTYQASAGTRQEGPGSVGGAPLELVRRAGSLLRGSARSSSCLTGWVGGGSTSE